MAADGASVEGRIVKRLTAIVAGCAAGLGLSACETPTYGAGGVISATEGWTRGPFANSGDLAALPAAEAPSARLEAAAAAKPGNAFDTIAHERKTSALFTGASFLARGEVLSTPAAEMPRTLVELTAPAGWRRLDNRLRHIESGLECPFEFDFKSGKKKGVLRLKDVTIYDQSNRDVSCDYANGGAAAITMYASFHPDISVEDHAAAAVASMRRSFTLKGVLPVIVVEIEDKDASTTSADLEAPIAGAFDIGEVAGAPYKTAIWIAKTHGWHVKTRATYAQDDATTELVAAVMFAANYLNIDMKAKNDPAASGPEV